MSIWGALAGGFAGTIVLTSAMRAASELHFTRIDLPFLLGTALTEDRLRAKALGYVIHFAFGLLFAVAYYGIFRAIDTTGWWQGALLGLAHGVFAGTALVNVLLPLIHPRMATFDTAARDAPLLEAPGFLLLNYGRSTPAITLAGHVAYGAIVGGFDSLSA
jgi:hypothetical protein